MRSFSSKILQNKFNDFVQVEREDPKPGDHIYTWRACYTYAHHGIYVETNTYGDTFHRKRQTTGTRKAHILLFSYTSPQREWSTSPRSPRSWTASWREASCTGTGTRSAKQSLWRRCGEGRALWRTRANYLLHNGFGKYDLLENNCENFALFCKTGLVRVGSDGCEMAKCGQVSTVSKAIVACGVGLVLHGMPVSVLVPYSVMRYKKDIGGCGKSLCRTIGQDGP